MKRATSRPEYEARSARVPDRNRLLRWPHFLLGGALGAAVLVPSAAWSDVDIAQRPLIAGGGVDPNVFLQLDDSGSMISNAGALGSRRDVVVVAVEEIVDAFPNVRFGANTIHDRFFVEMPDASDSGPYTDHNEDLIETLEDEYIASGMTPLRNALDRSGQYYEGSLGGRDSPIINECQQNFTVLLSDGFYNQSHTGTGDVDGDGLPNFLADIARHYYETDLRTDLPDNVSSVKADPLTGDRADHQHMVTFGIGFGLNGNLEDTDDDGWPEEDPAGKVDPPFTVDRAWTVQGFGGRADQTLDDMWHMAWNSTGELLAAQNADEVIESFSTALEQITDFAGSSASVATTSTEATSDSLFYQSVFDTEDWSGSITAFEANSDGSVDVGSVAWEAADGIPSPGSRNVFTIDPDDNGSTSPGIQFPTWSNLTSDQQDALNNDSDLAEYVLLGEDNNEQRNGGSFRDRPDTVLGDIVNSTPEVTRTNNRGYGIFPGEEGEDYGDYLANTKPDGSEFLYVGANDGMLHAFDASESGGDEVFAFAPNALFEDLPELADPDYTHQFFVDGQTTVNDAYVNGSWRRILVASAGRGAQSVFALDVTDPENFGEGDVLWELDGDDLDGLGNALGEIDIVKMNNGDWAAVFGNGYNSADGTPQLMIVPIEDPGSAIAIDPDSFGGVSVDGDAEGLGGVTLADTDGDGSPERAYGGDLAGNMWRFDLSGDNANDWDKKQSVDVLFKAESPNGDPQPITAAPAVDRHSDSDIDVNVLFGTGRFFATDDNDVPDDPRVETFYSVHDDGSSSELERDDLFDDQAILSEGTSGGDPFRVIDEDEEIGADDDGWLLDLVVDGEDAAGERLVEKPVTVDDRVFFRTLTPNDDPCAYGGESWLMELDAERGTRSEIQAFEDVDSEASGLGSDELVVGLTPVFRPEDSTARLIGSNTQQGVDEQETDVQPGLFGRQSWQELR